MRPKSLLPPSLAAVLVAAAALLLAQGGASSMAGSPASARAGTVAIANFMYAPSTVSVKVGTSVVFANHDSSEHTATSDTAGAFESGSLQQGQSVHVKLSKVGSFAYHCAFHAFMHGVIKVVP